MSADWQGTSVLHHELKCMKCCRLLKLGGINFDRLPGRRIVGLDFSIKSYKDRSVPGLCIILTIELMEYLYLVGV
eukprot:5012575-Karenia_brevis.AAC.1